MTTGTLRYRRRVGLTAVAAMVSVASGFGVAGASTPGSQSVTVPAAGHSVTVHWTGTIEPGSDPSSDCDTVSGA
ncbi:MAG TPA: hypothetical protein VNE21_07425, partial [Mycobacteriales bacterium]|nr:hypothetical protein [Mycobacteriales bacterium]